MAHGAPDHVRLADDAHSHFRWFRIWHDPVVVFDGIVRNLFYETGVKTMGSLFVQSDCKEMYASIHIDGFNIDIAKPEEIWDAKLFSSAGNAPGWSISQYDEIHQVFCFFWNPQFKCYVHKSIQIEVFHFEGADKNVQMAQLVYLEKQ